MARDSEIWVCPGCDGLEFDLTDEGISVVHKGCRSAVVLLDGRAHSLVCTTLERAKRRREIEHKAMTVCPYTMDNKKQDPLEEMLDELGLGEAMKISKDSSNWSWAIDCDNSEDRIGRRSSVNVLND